MNTRTAEGIAQAARTAVEAALWAPSIHNTQPWTFGVSGDEICLRADPDRKLRVSDPTGRQMTISCGAALLNVRVTLQALGYDPQVRRFPDPERPLLLATVRVRPGREPGEHTRLLHAEIERRRTHRSGFTALPVPDPLVEALVTEAAAEDGHLMPIRSEVSARVLAALTGAAQDVQSQDRLFVLELMRWARPPGSSRRDGVPAAGYPTDPRRTQPQHFAPRDYARGHEWGMAPDERVSASTGLVALLTTAGDRREDWAARGRGAAADAAARLRVRPERRVPHPGAGDAGVAGVHPQAPVLGRGAADDHAAGVRHRRERERPPRRLRRDGLTPRRRRRQGTLDAWREIVNIADT
ncbi:hypothetical protein AB0C14_17840 [Microbispora hainanensis]|uniref:Acg family FMN-binding oxidoreductase n=1 Tax=Microbispora hainanensis TaxID=568844 RepID=UPI0033E7D6FC